MYRKAVGLIAAAVVSLTLARPALAGNGSSGRGYGGSPGNVQETVQRGGGNLPFTGLDAVVLLAGGAVLIVVGSALRCFATARARS